MILGRLGGREVSKTTPRQASKIRKIVVPLTFENFFVFRFWQGWVEKVKNFNGRKRWQTKSYRYRTEG